MASMQSSQDDPGDDTPDAEDIGGTTIPPAQIDWSRKNRLRRDFRRQSSIAFLFLCMGIGALAFATPILLVLVGGYAGHFSISFFYHVPETRDLLVALLCSTGVFLVLYRGLSRWENRLLSLAGALLILVALVPMAADQSLDPGFSWHAAFAIGFFLCLFVVAMFFARRRLDFIIYPPLRHRLERLYSLAGALMLVLPLAVYALSWLDRRFGHTVFWIETAAIWSFAFFWFVKTYEYKQLLGISLTKQLMGRARPAG